MMESYQYELPRNGKRTICKQSSFSSDIMDEKLRRILRLTPTPENAKILAHDIKRSIFETREHLRKTPNFVKQIYDNLILIHEYNCRVAEVKDKYPLDDSFKELLIIYIKLELGVLKIPEYNNYTYCLSLEKRILDLLSTIYSKYCSNLQHTWRLILNLLIEIPYDVHEFFDEIIEKAKKKVHQNSEFGSLDRMKWPAQLTCYNKDDSINLDVSDPFMSYFPEISCAKAEKQTRAVEDEIIIISDDIDDTGQKIAEMKLANDDLHLPKRARLKNKTIDSEDVIICDDVIEPDQRTNSGRRREDSIYTSNFQKCLSSFEHTNSYYNNQCDFITQPPSSLQEQADQQNDDVVIISDEIDNSHENKSCISDKNCLNANEVQHSNTCYNSSDVDQYKDTKQNSANFLRDIIIDVSKDDSDSSDIEFVGEVLTPLQGSTRNSLRVRSFSFNHREQRRDSFNVNNLSDSRCISDNVISNVNGNISVQPEIRCILKQIERWMESETAQIIIQKDRDRLVIHKKDNIIDSLDQANNIICKTLNPKHSQSINVDIEKELAQNNSASIEEDLRTFSSPNTDTMLSPVRKETLQISLHPHLKYIVNSNYSDNSNWSNSDVFESEYVIEYRGSLDSSQHDMLLQSDSGVSSTNEKTDSTVDSTTDLSTNVLFKNNLKELNLNFHITKEHGQVSHTNKSISGKIDEDQPINELLNQSLNILDNNVDNNTLPVAIRNKELNQQEDAHDVAQNVDDVQFNNLQENDGKSEDVAEISTSTNIIGSSEDKEDERPNSFTETKGGYFKTFKNKYGNQNNIQREHLPNLPTEDVNFSKEASNEEGNKTLMSSYLEHTRSQDINEINNSFIKSDVYQDKSKKQLEVAEFPAVETVERNTSPNHESCENTDITAKETCSGINNEKQNIGEIRQNEYLDIQENKIRETQGDSLLHKGNDLCEENIEDFEETPNLDCPVQDLDRNMSTSVNCNIEEVRDYSNIDIEECRENLQDKYVDKIQDSDLESMNNGSDNFEAVTKSNEERTSLELVPIKGDKNFEEDHPTQSSAHMHSSIQLENEEKQYKEIEKVTNSVDTSTDIGNVVSNSQENIEINLQQQEEVIEKEEFSKSEKDNLDSHLSTNVTAALDMSYKAEGISNDKCLDVDERVERTPEKEENSNIEEDNIEPNSPINITPVLDMSCNTEVISNDEHLSENDNIELNTSSVAKQEEDNLKCKNAENLSGSILENKNKFPTANNTDEDANKQGLVHLQEETQHHQQNKNSEKGKLDFSQDYDDGSNVQEVKENEKPVDRNNEVSVLKFQEDKKTYMHFSSTLHDSLDDAELGVSQDDENVSNKVSVLKFPEDKETYGPVPSTPHDALDDSQLSISQDDENVSNKVSVLKFQEVKETHVPVQSTPHDVLDDSQLHIRQDDENVSNKVSVLKFQEDKETHMDIQSTQHDSQLTVSQDITNRLVESSPDQSIEGGGVEHPVEILENVRIGNLQDISYETSKEKYFSQECVPSIEEAQIRETIIKRGEESINSNKGISEKNSSHNKHISDVYKDTNVIPEHASDTQKDALEHPKELSKNVENLYQKQSIETETSINFSVETQDETARLQTNERLESTQTQIKSEVALEKKILIDGSSSCVVDVQNKELFVLIENNLTVGNDSAQIKNTTEKCNENESILPFTNAKEQGATLIKSNQLLSYEKDVNKLVSIPNQNVDNANEILEQKDDQIEDNITPLNLTLKDKINEQIITSSCTEVSLYEYNKMDYAITFKNENSTLTNLRPADIPSADKFNELFEETSSSNNKELVKAKLIVPTSNVASYDGSLQDGLMKFSKPTFKVEETQEISVPENDLYILADATSRQEKLPIPNSRLMEYPRRYVPHSVFTNTDHFDQAPSQTFSNTEVTDGSDSDGNLLIDEGPCSEDTVNEQKFIQNYPNNSEGDYFISNYNPPRVINGDVSLPIQNYLEIEVKSDKLNKPYFKTKAQVKEMPLIQLPQRSFSDSDDDDVPLVQRITSRTPSPKKTPKKYGNIKTSATIKGKAKTMPSENVMQQSALLRKNRRKSGEKLKENVNVEYVSKLRSRSGSLLTIDIPPIAEKVGGISKSDKPKAPLSPKSTLATVTPKILEEKTTLSTSPSKRKGRKPRKSTNAVENPSIEISILPQIKEDVAPEKFINKVPKQSRKTPKKLDLKLELPKTEDYCVEIIKLMEDPPRPSSATSPTKTPKERCKEACKAQRNNQITFPLLDFNEKGIPPKLRRKFDFFTNCKSTVHETAEKLKRQLNSDRQNKTQVEKLDMTIMEANVSEEYRENQVSNDVEVPIQMVPQVAAEVEVFAQLPNDTQHETPNTESDQTKMPCNINTFNDSNDSDLVSIAQEAAKHACENFENQVMDFNDSKVTKHFEENAKSKLEWLRMGNNVEGNLLSVYPKESINKVEDLYLERGSLTVVEDNVTVEERSSNITELTSYKDNNSDLASENINEVVIESQLNDNNVLVPNNSGEIQISIEETNINEIIGIHSENEVDIKEISSTTLQESDFMYNTSSVEDFKALEIKSDNVEENKMDKDDATLIIQKEDEIKEEAAIAVKIQDSESTKYISSEQVPINVTGELKDVEQRSEMDKNTQKKDDIKIEACMSKKKSESKKYRLRDISAEQLGDAAASDISKNIKISENNVNGKLPQEDDITLKDLSSKEKKIENLEKNLHLKTVLKEGKQSSSSNILENLSISENQLKNHEVEVDKDITLEEVNRINKPCSDANKNITNQSSKDAELLMEDKRSNNLLTGGKKDKNDIKEFNKKRQSKTYPEKAISTKDTSSTASGNTKNLDVKSNNNDPVDNTKQVTTEISQELGNFKKHNLNKNKDNSSQNPETRKEDNINKETVTSKKNRKLKTNRIKDKMVKELTFAGINIVSTKNKCKNRISKRKTISIYLKGLLEKDQEDSVMAKPDIIREKQCNDNSRFILNDVKQCLSREGRNKNREQVVENQRRYLSKNRRLLKNSSSIKKTKSISLQDTKNTDVKSLDDSCGSISQTKLTNESENDKKETKIDDKNSSTPIKKAVQKKGNLKKEAFTNRKRQEPSKGKVLDKNAEKYILPTSDGVSAKTEVTEDMIDREEKNKKDTEKKKSESVDLIFTEKTTHLKNMVKENKQDSSPSTGVNMVANFVVFEDKSNSNANQLNKSDLTSEKTIKTIEKPHTDDNKSTISNKQLPLGEKNTTKLCIKVQKNTDQSSDLGKKYQISETTNKSVSNSLQNTEKLKIFNTNSIEKLVKVIGEPESVKEKIDHDKDISKSDQKKMIQKKDKIKKGGFVRKRRRSSNKSRAKGESGKKLIEVVNNISTNIKMLENNAENRSILNEEQQKEQSSSNECQLKGHELAEDKRSNKGASNLNEVQLSMKIKNRNTAEGQNGANQTRDLSKSRQESTQIAESKTISNEKSTALQEIKNKDMKSITAVENLGQTQTKIVDNRKHVKENKKDDSTSPTQTEAIHRKDDTKAKRRDSKKNREDKKNIEPVLVSSNEVCIKTKKPESDAIINNDERSKSRNSSSKKKKLIESKTKKGKRSICEESDKVIQGVKDNNKCELRAIETNNVKNKDNSVQTKHDGPVRDSEHPELANNIVTDKNTKISVDNKCEELPSKNKDNNKTDINDPESTKLISKNKVLTPKEVDKTKPSLLIEKHHRTEEKHSRKIFEEKKENATKNSSSQSSDNSKRREYSGNRDKKDKQRKEGIEKKINEVDVQRNTDIVNKEVKKHKGENKVIKEGQKSKEVSVELDSKIKNKDSLLKTLNNKVESKSKEKPCEVVETQKDVKHKESQKLPCAGELYIKLDRNNIHIGAYTKEEELETKMENKLDKKEKQDKNIAIKTISSKDLSKQVKRFTKTDLPKIIKGIKDKNSNSSIQKDEAATKSKANISNVVKKDDKTEETQTKVDVKDSATHPVDEIKKKTSTESKKIVQNEKILKKRKIADENNSIVESSVIKPKRKKSDIKMEISREAKSSSITNTEKKGSLVNLAENVFENTVNKTEQIQADAVLNMDKKCDTETISSNNEEIIVNKQVYCSSDVEANSDTKISNVIVAQCDDDSKNTSGLVEVNTLPNKIEGSCLINAEPKDNVNSAHEQVGQDTENNIEIGSASQQNIVPENMHHKKIDDICEKLLVENIPNENSDAKKPNEKLNSVETLEESKETENIPESNKISEVSEENFDKNDENIKKSEKELILQSEICAQETRPQTLVEISQIETETNDQNKTDTIVSQLENMPESVDVVTKEDNQLDMNTLTPSKDRTEDFHVIIQEKISLNDTNSHTKETKGDEHQDQNSEEPIGDEQTSIPEEKVNEDVTVTEDALIDLEKSPKISENTNIKSKTDNQDVGIIENEKPESVVSDEVEKDTLEITSEDSKENECDLKINLIVTEPLSDESKDINSEHIVTEENTKQISEEISFELLKDSENQIVNEIVDPDEPTITQNTGDFINSVHNTNEQKNLERRTCLKANVILNHKRIKFFIKRKKRVTRIFKIGKRDVPISQPIDLAKESELTDIQGEDVKNVLTVETTNELTVSTEPCVEQNTANLLIANTEEVNTEAPVKIEEVQPSEELNVELKKDFISDEGQNDSALKSTEYNDGEEELKGEAIILRRQSLEENKVIIEQTTAEAAELNNLEVQPQELEDAGMELSISEKAIFPSEDEENSIKEPVIEEDLQVELKPEVQSSDTIELNVLNEQPLENNVTAEVFIENKVLKEEITINNKEAHSEKDLKETIIDQQCMESEKEQLTDNYTAIKRGNNENASTIDDKGNDFLKTSDIEHCSNEELFNNDSTKSTNHVDKLDQEDKTQFDEQKLTVTEDIDSNMFLNKPTAEESTNEDVSAHLLSETLTNFDKSGNMSPAEKMGMCFRNPSPPPANAGDVLCFFPDDDIQRLPIKPDFIEDRDDELLTFQEPSMISANTSSVSFTQGYMPSIGQSSLDYLFDNGEQLLDNSNQNVFAPTKYIGPVDSASVQNTKETNDQVSGQNVDLYNAGKNANSSNTNKALTSDIQFNYIDQVPPSSNLQQLSDNYYKQDLTKGNPSQLSQMLEPCDDEFLDDCGRDLESEDGLKKYLFTKSSKANPATSSSSKDQQGGAQLNGNIDDIKGATNQSQRSDHTYTRNPLLGGSMEGSLVEFGFEKTVLLNDLGTAGENSDELISQLEFPGPSNGILDNTSSLATDSDWSFCRSSANPNEILRVWDENCKVIVEPQPQLHYSNYYSDFSPLENHVFENQSMSSDASEFSHSSDSSDTSLRKRNIDMTDLLSNLSESEENRIKKMRLQPMQHRPKREKLKRYPRNPKKSEVAMIPARKKSRPTKLLGPSRSNSPKVEKEPISEQPKSAGLSPVTADAEIIPKVAPVTVGVTTRSVSKEIENDSSWQVTPATQSAYISGKVGKELSPKNFEPLQSPPPKPSLPSETVRNLTPHIIENLLKPDYNTSRAVKVEVDESNSSTAARTEPLKLKHVPITKVDVNGKTVFVKFSKPLGNINTPPLVPLYLDNSTKSPKIETPQVKPALPSDKANVKLATVKTKRDPKQPVQSAEPLILDTRSRTREAQRVIIESNKRANDGEPEVDAKRPRSLNDLFDTLAQGYINPLFKNKDTSQSPHKDLTCPKLDANDKVNSTLIIMEPTSNEPKNLSVVSHSQSKLLEQEAAMSNGVASCGRNFEKPSTSHSEHTQHSEYSVEETKRIVDVLQANVKDKVFPKTRVSGVINNKVTPQTVFVAPVGYVEVNKIQTQKKMQQRTKTLNDTKSTMFFNKQSVEAHAKIDKSRGHAFPGNSKNVKRPSMPSLENNDGNFKKPNVPRCEPRFSMFSKVEAKSSIVQQNDASASSDKFKWLDLLKVKADPQHLELNSAHASLPKKSRSSK